MILRTLLSMLLAGSGTVSISSMESVIQPLVIDKKFMGAVLVARDGEKLLDKGYGFANLEWVIPNTPATKFRLGSLTKQFTAASILILEDRGKLHTDDLVDKYLTDAPAAWDKIKIFHLLTHTSGIPNFTSFPEYAGLEPFPSTTEKLVARFRDKSLDFAPGDKWSYSNSGYVLLGYLIEKISGESYASFVRNNIFIPLGMKNSGYDSNSAIIPNRAEGYSPGANGPEHAGYIDMTIPHGAGALYSTTEDLLLWEEGLFGGKLISAHSLVKMTTPFLSDYAFGLQVRTVKGHKVIEHDGGIEGFNTFLAYYPDNKVTVVALANLNGNAPHQIGTQLAALALGQQTDAPTPHKTVQVPVDILKKYVGTYQFTGGGPKMLVTLEGNQLMEQLGAQDKFPIFPESEMRFFLKVVDAQIEFARDAEGKVTGLTLHQNGQDQKVPRISDEVQVRKEASVPISLLMEYAGNYELQPGVMVEMTVEKGQLMTQITGQPKFPLFAASDTRFFLKVVEAEVEFVRDSKGKVSGIILHQGGRDSAAQRK